MGNTVFRCFLTWLRYQMQVEAYTKFIKQAKRRAQKQKQQISAALKAEEANRAGGWMSGGVLPSFEDWWNSNFGTEQETKQELDPTAIMDDDAQKKQLWELAQMEGDENYKDWLENHIWTYVGLSAPLIGATGNLRAVLSGENMGLPMTDEVARRLELCKWDLGRTNAALDDLTALVAFGSTHTVNCVSTKMAFCDIWKEGSEPVDDEEIDKKGGPQHDLLCLDDLVKEIEGEAGGDPWASFPQLKTLLKDRVDWEEDFPPISIIHEKCKLKEKQPCADRTKEDFVASDVQTGDLFTRFAEVWKEEGEPMRIKKAQMVTSFWDTPLPNPLNHTWE